MLLIAALVLLISPQQFVLSTELCKSKEFWYDIQTGKCQQCKTCEEKSWVMEPCTEFMDTMCVDLLEIARSISRKTSKGLPEINSDIKREHKWHEMEDGDQSQNAELVKEEKAAISKSNFDDFERRWGEMVLVVLAVTVISILGAIIIMVLRYTGRICGRTDNRKNVARARLFSRDRLNTTEYMNNLATLDRRLAIEEILEKRKRAIFEPHLLNENVYTDEVFVDISGLPKNLPGDHEYEELDHRKCLLQMQEQ